MDRTWKSMLLALPTFSSVAHAEPEAARDEGKGCAMCSFKPVALIQVWGTVYDMDRDAQADASGYGDPEDDTGFKIKRFRFGGAGETHHIGYRLVLGADAPYDGLDAGDESVQVEDAEMSWDFARGAGVEIGKGRIPFSRDQMMGSAALTFQERGLGAEYIAPERSVGASFHYAKAGTRTEVGVWNSGDGLFGDDNLGKTLAGRFEWNLGPADTYTTWGDGGGKFSVGTGVGGFWTDDVSTTTAAGGADLMLRASRVNLLLDAAYAKVSPAHTDVDVPGVWEETTRTALTAQLSVGIQRWEPALRYTMLMDSAAGDFSQVLGGLVWHGDEDHLRIGGGYVLRIEDPAIANDTARLWAQFKL